MMYGDIRVHMHLKMQKHRLCFIVRMKKCFTPTPTSTSLTPQLQTNKATKQPFPPFHPPSNHEHTAFHHTRGTISPRPRGNCSCHILYVPPMRNCCRKECWERGRWRSRAHQPGVMRLARNLWENCQSWKPQVFKDDLSKQPCKLKQWLMLNRCIDIIYKQNNQCLYIVSSVWSKLKKWYCDTIKTKDHGWHFKENLERLLFDLMVALEMSLLSMTSFIRIE